LYRLHRGTDEHIAKLNDPSTLKLMVNADMLGEALYQSLRVFSRDVDAIGRELCDCDEHEDWRSINPYMSVEDWNAEAEAAEDEADLAQAEAAAFAAEEDAATDYGNDPNDNTMTGDE
jgi:hypothetical protein